MHKDAGGCTSVHRDALECTMQCCTRVHSDTQACTGLYEDGQWCPGGHTRAQVGTGTARHAQGCRSVLHVHKGSGAERLHKCEGGTWAHEEAQMLHEAAHRMQEEHERGAQGMHTHSSAHKEHKGHTRAQEDAQEMDKGGGRCTGMHKDAQEMQGRWMGMPKGGRGGCLVGHGG